MQIRGTFTNIRNVAGRGVCQFIIELPTEHAKSAIDELGWPDPADPKWVAIALLNEDANDNAA